MTYFSNYLEAFHKYWHNTFTFNILLAGAAFSVAIFVLHSAEFLFYKRKSYSIYTLLLGSTYLFGQSSRLTLFYIESPLIYVFTNNTTAILGAWVIYEYIRKDTNKQRYTRDNFYILLCFLSISLLFIVCWISHLEIASIFYTFFLVLKFIIFLLTGYKAYVGYKTKTLPLIPIVLGFCFAVVVAKMHDPFSDFSSSFFLVEQYILIVFGGIFMATLLGYLKAENNKELEKQYIKNHLIIQEKRQILEHQNSLLETLVEQKTKELSDLNTTKDKLFAIIGHDLRSPMVNLQASISFLKNTDRDTYHSSLDDLSIKVNQLYNTLDNLLSWSAVQIRGNEVTQNILYMSSSIDETLALLEYSISSKNINIIHQICSSSQISFNEHRLQVILRNIIGNAIKFTPQEGFIRIYDKEDNNHYHLFIQDSGIGIPETLLKNWQTIHQSRLGTMGEKGTGLGLRLCRDLLVASKGDMFIRSNEKGTTVELLFAK